MDPPPPPSSRSWSIYGREEITQRYEVLSRIGSGAYSDVYRGRRRSDGLSVALKEVHDYQSAFREIEALQNLRGAPNVVDLLEYFWQEDDDAVLVLEFLPVDLDSVIREAKRSGGGIPTGELKQWMLQILRGVDACHRNSLVHRDLKPSNLLISAEGVLKLADFGQARMLQVTRFISRDNNGPLAHSSENEASLPQQPLIAQQVSSWPDGPENQTAQEPKPPICEDDYLQEFDSLKGKDPMDDTDNDSSLRDGDASCHATCSTADMEDDPFDGTYPCEAGEGGEAESCALTSCVGTRWFRAPELLYGSTDYGQEVDLWSLGCIFAELLSLEPLFPGTSDIEQYGRIISVLGDLNEETWPGCSKLPDYSKVFFAKVENPIGLHACLPGRSAVEVDLVRRLVCYDPSNRATAMELLHDKYFNEEPLPVPLNELRVPLAKGGLDDESPPGEWGDFKDLGSDSDFEEFGRMDASTTASEYRSTYLF